MVLQENEAEGKKKKKSPTLPHTRRPCVFPPLRATSLRVSGAGCSFGGMNKLTWLFWAEGQRQTCQWSRQLARPKTPQYPSQTLFSFCFPSLTQSRDQNTLYWYHCRYKHCYFLRRLCCAINAYHNKLNYSHSLYVLITSQGCYSCLVCYLKPEGKRFSCSGVENLLPSEKGLTYGRTKSNLPAFRSRNRTAVKNTLAPTNRQSPNH